MRAQAAEPSKPVNQAVFGSEVTSSRSRPTVASSARARAWRGARGGTSEAAFTIRENAGEKVLEPLDDRGLFAGVALHGNHGWLWRVRLLQRGDGARQICILPRQRQRLPVGCQRCSAIAATRVDLRDPLERREVLGRRGQHARQFHQRLIQLAEVQQRPAERGPGARVLRVNGQAGAAGADSIGRPAGAAQLLCEGGKSKRRRIHLDPASQLLNSGAVRHGNSVGLCAGRRHGLTVTFFVMSAVRLAESLTRNVTTYPAAVE